MRAPGSAPWSTDEMASRGPISDADVMAAPEGHASGTDELAPKARPGADVIGRDGPEPSGEDVMAPPQREAGATD
jgi:hypothetical protein